MVYDRMPVTCRMCWGNGEVQGGWGAEACPGCRGRGGVLVYGEPVLCRPCDGSGEVPDGPFGMYAALCGDCGGSGWAGRVG